MTQSLIIDCAVSGAWKWDGKPSLQNAACVRVAYMAMNGTLPFESSSFVVWSDDWPRPVPNNEKHAGVTMARLQKEESKYRPDKARDLTFWRHLAAAQTIIGHALSFHIGALSRLVQTLEVAELADWRAPRDRFDTLLHAGAAMHAERSVSLVAAHAWCKPTMMDDLPTRQRQALDHPTRPLATFGVIQVRSVEMLWRRLTGAEGGEDASYAL